MCRSTIDVSSRLDLRAAAVVQHIICDHVRENIQSLLTRKVQTLCSNIVSYIIYGYKQQNEVFGKLKLKNSRYLSTSDTL